VTSYSKYHCRTNIQSGINNWFGSEVEIVVTLYNQICCATILTLCMPLSSCQNFYSHKSKHLPPKSNLSDSVASNSLSNVNSSCSIFHDDDDDHGICAADDFGVDDDTVVVVVELLESSIMTSKSSTNISRGDIKLRSGDTHIYLPFRNSSIISMLLLLVLSTTVSRLLQNTNRVSLTFGLITSVM